MFVRTRQGVSGGMVVLERPYSYVVSSFMDTTLLPEAGEAAREDTA